MQIKPPLITFIRVQRNMYCDPHFANEDTELREMKWFAYMWLKVWCGGKSNTCLVVLGTPSQGDILDHPALPMPFFFFLK